MRVESVASQPDRAGRYAVRFDSGETLRLYRQTVEDFGLYPGRELSEPEYGDLCTAAGEMSAKMRAVRIVSASSVSKKDLERRLVHKGEDPQQAKEAVRWLSEMDILDDRKTARQVVERCIGKGYGLNRAKQALYEKQIPKQYWEEVLEDYPDQSPVIEDYLRSHLEAGCGPRELRRTVDALIRKGHSYSQIRRVLDALSLDNDFLEES